MRLLNLPLPIFAATLAQVDPPQVSGPAWVNSFLVALFVLGYFLNLMGKFPGVSKERRATCFGLDEATRHKLDEMHEVVTAQDDNLPRWYRAWAPVRETLQIKDLVTELADLRLAWEAEREEWKVERARMELRITQLEEVVRLQEHAIRAAAD